jgi:hypothetical protein
LQPFFVSAVTSAAPTAVPSTIQIGTDFPLSPAEVDPNTSLADLRAIKAHWLTIADQTGDLRTLLLVTRELGQEITPTSWMLTLADDLTVDLNVTGFQSWRDGDLARLTVTWHGRTVCHLERTARRFYGDNQLFVPGAWMDAIRTLQPQAEQQSTARYQAALEADRKALLAELDIPTQAAPAVPSDVIVQTLATPNQPLTTRSANPFVVDGFEITRLDFFVKDNDVSGSPLVIVQRLAVTSPVRGDHVIVATEEKPVDLAAAAAWLHKNGYCTRRWPAVVTPTYQKPAGMRAWKADQPWPVRTEGQIRKIRQQLNGHAAGIGHSLNLAFDL